MSFTIEPQNATHQSQVECLIHQSFGPDREKRTVFKFRKNTLALDALCFVARDGEKLIGSIAFWPVTMPNGDSVPLLGPLAVLPDVRGLGVGRALVTHGITACKLKKFPAILIVGDPGYYAPFGFHVAPVSHLNLGGPVTPLTLMGLDLQKGYLQAQSGEITPMNE